MSFLINCISTERALAEHYEAHAFSQGQDMIAVVLRVNKLVNTEQGVRPVSRQFN